MYRLAYDRRGRLRICGRHLGKSEGGERVCYGAPGHSGMHGRDGNNIEWLMPSEEYERFAEGQHKKITE